MEPEEIERAEKQIRSAWIIGLICSGLLVIVSVIGYYSDDFRYSSGFDTYSLFDAALIAALSYGVYKKNRYCALGLLLYFVISIITGAASEGQLPLSLGTLLFGYFLLMGTVAAFKLHRHQQLQQEPGGIKGRGFAFYAAAGVGMLLLGGIAVLLYYGAKGPGTEVVPGRQLKAKYVSFAEQEGMLDREEKIQFWYSDAFSDFKEGFYFFTDKNVVLYNQNWEQPAVKVPLASIKELDFIHDPSFSEDSRILLYLAEGDFLEFPVSSENGGDQRYYERLKQLWQTTAALPEPEATVVVAIEE